jgi:fatty-acyl-CoA synthase
MGAVLHTLNLRLSPEQLAYIVKHAGDRFLIIDDVLWPLFARIAGQVSLERVIVVRHGEGPLPEGAPNVEGRSSASSGATIDYEAALARSTPVETFPVLDENTAAGICYTSGTTGDPKGVVYSHRSVMLHAMSVAMVDCFGLGNHDTLLPVVPMFHVNAWGLPFTAAMVGAKLVLPGPHLDAPSVLELISGEKVTISAGVPTVWMGLLAELERNRERYPLQPGLRMVVGGSAAPEAMVRAFDRFGMTLIHAWGMTEMSPLGTVSKLKPHLLDESEDLRYARRCTQGVPVPLVEVRVINEEGEVPWDGKGIGELVVRGPWVTGSYLHLPDAQQSFTPDSWFKTGDIVTIDEEGYVKITDRLKDVIKSGGEWISSVDLENALMGHPAVREAAVIAIPDPKWAERPLAVVVFKDGSHASGDELREFLAPRFPKFWLPDRFETLEAIPRTASGKFLKSALRDRFALSGS